MYRHSPGQASESKWAALLRADLLLVCLVLAVVWGLVRSFSPPDLEVCSYPVQQEAVAPEANLEQDASLGELPESGEPVRFLMQNVKDYFVEGERSRSRYTHRNKPVEAREAIADVIASVKPEVVGLVEIGGPMALQDLQRRLEKRGLRYPWYRVLCRSGEDRALAVLSQHPIVQDHSQANYGLYGMQRRSMLRGILDVTVRFEDGRYFRLMGVHLKSRVSDDQRAADSLRAREALTLARYVQEAIRSQKKVPLLVFGDWNDGPADASLGVLSRGVSRDAALSRLNPVDSRGESWTLYYKDGSAYHVFDQIYVNSVLRKRMGRKSECGIVDIPASQEASDHRAVWCELR